MRTDLDVDARQAIADALIPTRCGADLADREARQRHVVVGANYLRHRLQLPGRIAVLAKHHVGNEAGAVVLHRFKRVQFGRFRSRRRFPPSPAQRQPDHAYRLSGLLSLS